MYDFLTSLAAVAVVLGVMITVHELGHFVSAKLFGVRVEQFAIGFGKRLFGFRKGETDYRVNLLPLGGYVKMSGENPMEAKTGDPGEFTSHPRWQRFIIAFAGPFMNILLAVALLAGVYMVRYEHPAYLDKPAVIGWVLDGSPAQKAGLQAGDRIVRVNDIQNPTWEDVLPEVVLSPGHPVSLAVQRGDQIISTSITPAPTPGPEEFGNPGWAPDQPIVVSDVDPSLPAAKAGIKTGDVIIALNGQPTRSIMAMLKLLQTNKSKPVELTVGRNHQELKFQITPEYVKDPASGDAIYRTGIGTNPVEVEQLPFFKAISKSIEENKRNSVLILEVVKKMVKREVSVKQLEGPIRIAQVSGQAAREEGWTPLLSLMAIISLNLGIFNLFPFPILDGGIILMLAIEAIRRRDISLPVKEKIYQLAFVLLILFAVVVIYNDLMKTIPNVMQRLP